MLLSLCLLTISMVTINCQSSPYYCGNTYSYYGTSGTISSPNYPSFYRNGADCIYNWTVPPLSSVLLTIQHIDIENCGSCACDWLEISCSNQSVVAPARYCGRGRGLNPVTFSICRQILIRFRTDVSVTGSGFTIRYQAIPIDARNSTIPPTMPPYFQCMAGCFMQYSICICPVTGYVDATTSYCSPPCYFAYDFYGYLSCRCSEVTTARDFCSSGCYRTTDWLGYPYCQCPQTTRSPHACPYGCYTDFDYWGDPFCSCQASTQPPMWCSSGCVSDTDSHGHRYCRCPTTSLPPCRSPCYYIWDYTYDYRGIRVCNCPTTTPTTPSPGGCGQTLTASYGIVTSPNYPNSYARGIDCYQYIAVPRATSISIQVLDLNVYFSNSYICEYDYVEITGCDGSISRFCVAYTIPTSGLVFQCTDHSIVTIRFHSYYYYYTGYRGFKLSYSAGFASNCSDSGYYLSQGSTGVITSPNYPNNFPGYSECFNYLFTDDDNIKIRITFDQLRLEDSSTCTNVFVKLTCQDGSPYTQTICGVRIPAPMTFDCRTLQIWFKSSAASSFSPRKYRLSYQAVTKSTTTTTAPRSTLAAGPGADDLPQAVKIGIGLGVGVGGFFLVILIVVIIVLIVISQRQAARQEQRHLEDLAIILRNVNGGEGSEPSVSIRNWRGGPGVVNRGLVAEGFTDRMAEVAGAPPSYMDGIVNEPETQLLGEFVAEDSETLLIA